MTKEAYTPNGKKGKHQRHWSNQTILTPSKQQDYYSYNEIDKQELKILMKNKIAKITKRIGVERGYNMERVIQE